MGTSQVFTIGNLNKSSKDLLEPSELSRLTVKAKKFCNLVIASGTKEIHSHKPSQSTDLFMLELSAAPPSYLAGHPHWNEHTLAYYLPDPQIRLHLPQEPMKPVLSYVIGSQVLKKDEPLKLFEICEDCN
jgi:hypothetical protein